MKIRVNTSEAGMGVTLSYPDGRIAPVTVQASDEGTGPCYIFENVQAGWKIEPAAETDRITAVIDIISD